MPFATNGDVALRYESTGTGPDTAVFVGDVGFGPWQWAWQHRAVAGPFRALVFDHRGVGASDTPSGPWSIGDLADDVRAVLADADVSRAHLVGAGLGGVVAVAVAHRSSRVRSLALLGSGAGEPTPMDAFAATDDTAALRTTTEALLSDAFCAEQPDVVDRIVEWRAAEDGPRAVWEAQTAALDRYDPPPLYEVTLPTLAVHGESDGQWPVDAARSLADDLPRGEFVGYEGAGHLVGVERSRPVNDRLVGHVEGATDGS
jgi:pimeloyl-ACP methyl ester carboxylesterase